MTLPRTEPGVAADLRGRLPLKITGIVFWGMMLVGLIFSLIQLQTLEDQLIGRYVINADRFSKSLSEYLVLEPESDPEQLNAFIPVLDKISDGDEIQIDYDNGTIDNKTTGSKISFNPLPDFALEIINAGGLLNRIAKNN